MGRKKINSECQYCGENTEVMQKPVYVESYKGIFCDFECYKMKKKDESINENRI